MDKLGKKLKPLFATLLMASFVAAQTAQTPPAAAPRPARAATSRAASPVDSVIQLVKSGMSEGLIVKTLQKQNKPIDLSPADLVKLKNAGVSENIIGIMMDPSSAPAPAAAPVATPAPAPAAAAPPPMAAPPQTAARAIPNTTAVNNAMKKRVIVDEFDYSAVMTAVQSVFGTNQNIGKGIRAMLTNQLGQQGKMVIVERAKIDALMKEQDRNVSSRVKKGSGARVGQISGADALMTGDIIIFGRDDKHRKVSGGGIFGAGIGAIANAKSTDKAVVAIDYRFVDAETSEILSSGEARGESSRKSSGWGALGGAFGQGVAGIQVDMTSSNFAETIIGEATLDCVKKLAEVMNTQVEAMKKVQHDVEAQVADVSGNSLTITAGTSDGVNIGDVFDVLRVVRDVKDPTTKEVLDRITENVGVLTIVNVRDKIAVGNYAGAPAQVSFVVRKRTS